MRTITNNIEVHTERFKLHAGNICAFKEKRISILFFKDIFMKCVFLSSFCNTRYINMILEKLYKSIPLIEK